MIQCNQQKTTWKVLSTNLYSLFVKHACSLYDPNKINHKYSINHMSHFPCSNLHLQYTNSHVGVNVCPQLEDLPHWSNFENLIIK